MRCIARRTIVFLALAGAGYWTANPGSAQVKDKPAAVPAPAATLKVGDKAPPLVVEKWLKGTPVPRFEPGRLYAVDFWSTWCPTCISSMPHLAELQRTYKDKQLTIIAVDIWERKYTPETLKKVENFVKERGDDMDYVVAYDGKAGATNAAYMKAAGRHQIPCTFLIDGNGVIIWIGLPWLVEIPLDAYLAGKWDPTKGAQEVTRVEGLLKEFREKSSKAPKEALALWETLQRDFPVMARKVASTAFKLYLATHDYPRGYKLAAEIIERAIAAKDAHTLNEVAWTIVDPAGTAQTRDLDLALKAAMRADELSKHVDASILDTLARVYFVKGDIDRAIEVETKAVGLAKEQYKEKLQQTLDQYRAAKK